MSNELDDLKKQWKGAKQAVASHTSSAAKLAALGETQKKKLVWFQYGNAIVLTLVAIMLVLCFIYLFPFQDTLSRTGVALMIGGLIVRIAIELFSVVRSKRIQLLDSSVRNLESTIAYYEFRKKVHGPVTTIIVGLYVIGFYMLTPEFLRYIDWRWMLFYDIIFVVGGIILVWQIRKGIREEMLSLQQVIKARQEIVA